MTGKGRKLSHFEIFVIIVAAILICYVIYNAVFDKMIEERLQTEEGRQQTIQTELALVNAKITELEGWQAELARVQDADAYIIMPSYNAENMETSFLNSIFPAEQGAYSQSTSAPTRTGDQVRRTITVKFESDDYDRVKTIITAIANCSIRCLIDEISLTQGKKLDKEWNVERNAYNVTLKFTFYETMADGREDSLLKGQ